MGGALIAHEEGGFNLGGEQAVGTEPGFGDFGNERVGAGSNASEDQLSEGSSGGMEPELDDEIDVTIPEDVDLGEVGDTLRHLRTEIAPTSDSGIPTLFTGDEPGVDFHNVATNAQLGAAIQGAPTNGNLRVINVTGNLDLLGAVPAVGAGGSAAANGRLVNGGRNVVIQSIQGATLTLPTTGTSNTAWRHFSVAGTGSRLVINEGIVLTRQTPGDRTNGNARGGVTVGAGGRLTLNGGIIHGNHQTANQGGGVHVDGAGAVFEMFSGTLSENSTNHSTHGAFGAATRAGGGGIIVNNGTFNLHGGLITRNRTDNSGGAILLRTTNATFNMYGGVIYRNWNGGHWNHAIGAETSHGAAAGSGQGAGAMDMSNGPTFNMYGGMFLDNFTSGHGGDGGAIESGTNTAANRPTINLFGGTFRGNHGRQGGAINAHTGTDVRLLDPTTATDPLGVAAVQPYLATGVVFEDNVAAGLGGAIVTRGGNTPTIIMNAGTLRYNRAQGNAPTDGVTFGPRGSGGAIALADTTSSTFTMNGGIIHHNTANNNVTTDAAHNASQGGGGVYITPLSTFTMNGGRIVDNETGQRAGVSSTGATSGGGGVHNRGTFNFNGGEISRNRSGHTAATSGGGGIFSPSSLTIPANASAGINPILMTENSSAGVGGAIAMLPTVTTTATVPTITMTAGTIHTNTAAHSEASEGIHYAPTLNMNATLATAITTGVGATTQFNIAGTAEIEGIHYAPVVNFGRTGSGTLITHRDFNLSGNAILSGTINITPLQRSINGTNGNVSTGTGTHTHTFNFNMTGSPTILNGILFDEHSAGPNLDVAGSGTGGGFRSNHYTANFLGGTIYGGIDFTPHVRGAGGSAGQRVNGVHFNLSGTEVRGRTTENGGVIRYEPTMTATGGAAAATNRSNTSNFNLDAGIIRDGIATNNGGGIYHNPHSILPTTATAGTHNINSRMREITVTNSIAGNDGGGLYMTYSITGGTDPAPHFNLSEAGFARSITHNEAGGHGGGIYIASRMHATANTILNSEIDDNVAGGYGGGIFFENTVNTVAIGTLELRGSSVSDNTAVLNGGGVSAHRFSHIRLTDSHINENETTTGNGGGIHFDPIGEMAVASRLLTVNGESTISGNLAPLGNGAGIHATRAEINVNNHSEMIGNTAGVSGGAIYLADGGDLTIRDHVQIDENRSTESGGGVYLDDSYATLRDNARIHDNEAINGGGVSATDSSVMLIGGTVSNNEAENGAGVYLTGSSMTMHGHAEIYDNVAGGYGGGVYMESASTLDMYNHATIRNNDATYGGGAYLAPDSAQLSVMAGTVTFSDNTAEVNGGAVYVAIGTYTALQVQSGTFTGNHAGSYGGAIFTEDYEYFVDALTPGTYGNLIIGNVADVVFYDNYAGAGAFSSPMLSDQVVNAASLSYGNASAGDNPINNYDINFERYETVDITFIKMDELLRWEPVRTESLEGATFEIFRRINLDYCYDATFDYTDEDCFKWHGSATSDADGRVTFYELTTNERYYVIETDAPTGFMLPEAGHYWVIEINGVGGATLTGNHVPYYNQCLESEEYEGLWYWCISNERSMIPMTGLGGEQSNRLLVLLTLLGLATSGTWFTFRQVKKSRHQVAPVRVIRL